MDTAPAPEPRRAHLFPVCAPLAIPAQARSAFLWGDVRVHGVTLSPLPACSPTGSRW
jgi:hypothetical protein